MKLDPEKLKHRFLNSSHINKVFKMRWRYPAIYVGRDFYGGYEDKWLEGLAFEFDDPGDCIRCGDKIGGFLRVVETKWGGDEDRPDVNPYYILDRWGLVGMCEDCFDWDND